MTTIKKGILLSNTRPVLQKCICLGGEPLTVLVTGVNINKSQTVLYQILDDSSELNKLIKTIGDDENPNFLFGELYRTYIKRHFRYYFYDTSDVKIRLESLNSHFDNTTKSKGMVFIIDCPFCKYLHSKESSKSFVEIYYNGNTTTKKSPKAIVHMLKSDFFECNVEMQQSKNYLLNCIYTILKLPNSNSPKITILINHFDKNIQKSQLKLKIADVCMERTCLNSENVGLRCPWVSYSKIGLPLKTNGLDFLLDDMFYKMFGLEISVLPNIGINLDMDTNIISELDQTINTMSCSDLQQANSITRKKVNLFTHHVSLQTLHGVDKFVKKFQEIVAENY